MSNRPNTPDSNLDTPIEALRWLIGTSIAGVDAGDNVTAGAEAHPLPSAPVVTRIPPVRRIGRLR